MIGFLTILFALCFIGCILKVLIYIDRSDYSNPLGFLIFLILGIFCLFTIFCMFNIK